MRILLAALLLCLNVAAHAQTIPTDAEVKWLRSWVPVECCVTSGTHGCCFKIKAADIEPQPGDSWKILATGQVIARTNWSPDGHYWRCACDNINGKWVVHLHANTRCIFPAMQSTKR